MTASDITILKAFLYAITECSEELPLSLTFGINRIVKDWDNGNEKALVSLEELLYNYDEVIPSYQQACVILKQRNTQPSSEESSAPSSDSSAQAPVQSASLQELPKELPSLRTIGFAILRADNPQSAAKRKLEELRAGDDPSPMVFLELSEE